MSRWLSCNARVVAGCCRRGAAELKSSDRFSVLASGLGQQVLSGRPQYPQRSVVDKKFGEIQWLLVQRELECHHRHFVGDALLNGELM